MRETGATKAWSHTGLSVPEVVVAIAFLAITFVSLLAVLIGGIRTDRKAFYRETAASTARSLLTKILSEVTRDTPAGTKSNFWAMDHPTRSSPYRQGTEVAGDTEFHYEVCTLTVVGPNAVPFGAPSHRLKQVDIYVRWSSDDERTGYGSTVYHDRRIISEASGDPF